jgi:hypothetical protein
MDKYSVLLLIIVYAIALGITGCLFYPDEYGLQTSVLGVHTTTFTPGQSYSYAYKFLLGALGVMLPGVPAFVNAILFVPYIILVVYFIYLNLPKVAGSGSPPP